MDINLNPEQLEKVFKICDILCLEDLTVASIILQQANWDVQKAVMSIQQDAAASAPPAPAQNQEYISYDFDEEPEQYEYNEYEEILQKEEDLINKKRMFENEYESIPLLKTTSEVPNKLEKRLSYDRLLTEDYSKHRHQYQANLLHNSELFCQKILDSKSPGSAELSKYYQSKRKNETNRQFISQLHKQYKTKINFTFGTFLLNLARSYLDKKFLLVYIHSSLYESNRSIQMLLTQTQIANFVNKHCINYGMFDSSDDYEIVQKYVPMKDLPAFALFKLDKKNQTESFISSYVILQKNAENFMEWVATNIGVPIKKKAASDIKPEQKQEQLEVPKFRPSDIIYEQNLEYEEMAKLYQMRRELSKNRKLEKEEILQELKALRRKFDQIDEFVPGQSIQVKFRLPLSGKSLLRVFKNSDLVSQMFDYVSCFGREEFEEEFADFDLTQTFPRLSLMDRKEERIGDIFEGSDRENVIVKEL